VCLVPPGIVAPLSSITAIAGEDVLDFWQAQEKIKSIAQPDSVRKIGQLRVSEAFDRYIPKLRAKNARTAKDTEGRVRKHFFPKFESYRVIDLTQTEIGNWHASLAKSSDDDEVVRRSKDSANRVLSMVKAFLNDAWQDNEEATTDDDTPPEPPTKGAFRRAPPAR
jgi:hypothetical protein